MSTASAPEKSQKSHALTYAILLTVVSVSISGALLFLNSQRESELVQMRSNLSAKLSDNEQLAKVPAIQQTAIIERSGEEIERNIRLHRFDQIIAVIDRIRSASRLELTGFSYGGGKISTEAVARGSNSVAVVVDFLRTYREASQLKSPYDLFSLGKVYSL